MKWLFWLVLFANAGYAAWNIYSPLPAPERTKAVAGQPPGKHLVLLSERGPDQAPDRRQISPPIQNPESGHADAAAPATAGTSAPGLLGRGVEAPVPDDALKVASDTASKAEPPAPKVAATPPEPVPVCRQYDGIEDATAAKLVRAALEKTGANVVGHGSAELPVTHYWVMLPAGDHARTAQAIRALERARISDFYRVRSGPDVNAISLGVFSTVEAAQRRAAQIRALRPTPGRPRIQERKQTTTRQWMLVRWPDSKQLEEPKFPSSVEGVGAKAVSCP